MASLLQDVAPAIFQTIEGLDIVRSIEELNSRGCSIRDRLGFVCTASIFGWMSTRETGLPTFYGERGVVECDAIARIGKDIPLAPTSESENFMCQYC